MGQYGKADGPTLATGRGKTINETGAGLRGSVVGILRKDTTIRGKNYQIHYYRRKTLNERGAELGGSAFGMLRKDITIREKLSEFRRKTTREKLPMRQALGYYAKTLLSEKNYLSFGGKLSMRQTLGYYAKTLLSLSAFALGADN